MTDDELPGDSDDDTEPPRTYEAVRAESNCVVIGSTTDGTEWTWHGYQAGAVLGGDMMTDEHRRDLGGRAMTDGELRAVVAEQIGRDRSVYAIPLLHGRVGRNFHLDGSLFL
jgi:hypothetical protein